MKIKDEFMLVELSDRTVAVGLDALNGFIELNRSGIFLWKQLEKGCTEDELAAALVERYGIDRNRAEQDTADFLEMLRKWNALEEN